jgi:hypothetical protein
MRYIGWLFGPFFRWWWAAVTGIIGLIAFAWTPASISISKPVILLLLLFVSALFFYRLQLSLKAGNFFLNVRAFGLLV